VFDQYYYLFLLIISIYYLINYPQTSAIIVTYVNITIADFLRIEIDAVNVSYDLKQDTNVTWREIIRREQSYL
jgi:hypothetical protein